MPLYKVLIDKEDVNAVSRVIKRGMDWALGPEIENFEKLLAEYVGSDYCVTFNSGTSALHASLIAMDTKKGDEIIVPSFTFIATANSVLMVNSKPRFVDIEESTYGLNPNLVEQAVSKKTKVIMPVHYAGLPCKIEEISLIAKQKKITLIEDAAESLGSKIHHKKVGTFGDLAIFSFAGNKVLTTGEGGAITTNSKKLYEKLKLIRSHGRVDTQNYFSSISKPDYVTLGYNWRMSSITAALAISQLGRMDKLIDLRRKNASYISSKLSKFKQIKIPKEPTGYYHVYQLYSIGLSSLKLRNGLMQFLAKKSIMSKVFFNPIHKTIFYRKLGYSNTILPITEKISNQILSLPMYPSMRKEDLQYLCESIKEYVEKQ